VGSRQGTRAGGVERGGTDQSTGDNGSEVNDAEDDGSAWVVALGMCVAPLHGQVINTVAGTTWFFPRQPMTALTAPPAPPSPPPPLSLRLALAADLQGNVYISDVNNNVIMRLSQGVDSECGRRERRSWFLRRRGACGRRFPVAVWRTTARYVCVRRVAGGRIRKRLHRRHGNNRIRKITSTGTIVTVAGNGLPGFFGDGSSAVSASLNSPRGVAVDAAGNLYIGGTLSFRVRKVTPAGIISTVAGMVRI